MVSTSGIKVHINQKLIEKYDQYICTPLIGSFVTSLLLLFVCITEQFNPMNSQILFDVFKGFGLILFALVILTGFASYFCNQIFKPFRIIKK